MYDKIDTELLEMACREALLITEEVDKDYILNEMKMGEATEFVFEKTEYQEFFQSKLKQFGVSSPAALDDDKKKEFYNQVDKEWTGEKVKEGFKGDRLINRPDIIEEEEECAKEGIDDKSIQINRPKRKRQVVEHVEDLLEKMSRFSTGVKETKTEKRKRLAAAMGMGKGETEKFMRGEAEAEKIKKKESTVRKAKKVAGVMTLTTAIAGIIYGGYKVYKNYLSKAARACKGSSNKQECMATFRKQAYRAQIKAVQKGKKICAKTKDPGKCKAKIEMKISQIRGKMK